MGKKQPKQAPWRKKLAIYWRSDIRPLLIMAAVLFSLRSSLADWNDVPTGSMKPTLLEGDRVFVNKLAYDLKVPFTTLRMAEWSTPSRGDVVVFYSPHDEVRLVKRIVGLPGDTVELRGGELILNGVPARQKPLPGKELGDMSTPEKLARFYSIEELPGKPHAVAATPFQPARRDMHPLRVPDGFYFAMGDNRDESFDSRYFGLVEQRRIIGRAQAVVFSLDRKHWWLPRAGRFLVPL